MSPVVLSLFNPRDLQGARARTRSLIVAGSFILMGVGLGWAAYFVLRGDYAIFSLEWMLGAEDLACVFHAMADTIPR